MRSAAGLANGMARSSQSVGGGFAQGVTGGAGKGIAFFYGIIVDGFAGKGTFILAWC